MKVLFVCTQNRGRSQMAKALFNKLALEHSADSAGTKVIEEGETLNSRAKASDGTSRVLTLLAEVGIDAGGFVSRQIKEEMLPDYDKIIVMAERDTVPAWLKKSDKYEHWDVPDPRFWDIDDVRNIRELIKVKILSLLSTVEVPVS